MAFLLGGRVIMCLQTSCGFSSGMFFESKIFFFIQVIEISSCEELLCVMFGTHGMRFLCAKVVH